MSVCSMSENKLVIQKYCIFAIRTKGGVHFFLCGWGGTLKREKSWKGGTMKTEKSEKVQRWKRRNLKRWDYENGEIWKGGTMTKEEIWKVELYWRNCDGEIWKGGTFKGRNLKRWKYDKGRIGKVELWKRAHLNKRNYDKGRKGNYDKGRNIKRWNYENGEKVGSQGEKYEKVERWKRTSEAGETRNLKRGGKNQSLTQKCYPWPKLQSLTPWLKIQSLTQKWQLTLYFV